MHREKLFFCHLLRPVARTQDAFAFMHTVCWKPRVLPSHVSLLPSWSVRFFPRARGVAGPGILWPCPLGAVGLAVDTGRRVQSRSGDPIPPEGQGVGSGAPHHGTRGGLANPAGGPPCHPIQAGAAT